MKAQPNQPSREQVQIFVNQETMPEVLETSTKRSRIREELIALTARDFLANANRHPLPAEHRKAA
ncbi:MAG: hypothetical protein U1D30_11495 [Planctomycetota bacterium]